MANTHVIEVLGTYWDIEREIKRTGEHFFRAVKLIKVIEQEFDENKNMIYENELMFFKVKLKCDGYSWVANIRMYKDLTKESETFQQLELFDWDADQEEDAKDDTIIQASKAISFLTKKHFLALELKRNKQHEEWMALQKKERF